MEFENIGRYKVIAELGRGGMATVYSAHDPRFDRDVAVKVLPQTMMHDPQFRTRFEREAKMIGLLEHPAIVPVYDFGEEENQPYIVMRLMTGGALSDKLEAGPLSPQEAGSIITRVGQALDVAHSKGIIHRDLKPGNILFDQYGNAFLSDFGIARISDGGGTLTGSQIIGTPAYMSPEQIQGDKQIDGRSDLYALGIILFHILTKDMPFKADTPAKLMMAHVLDPVPRITKLRPGLPAGVDQVIEKAMQKDPDDRYATGAALAADFNAVLQGKPIDSTATRISGLPGSDSQSTMVSAGAVNESAATMVGQSTPLPGAGPTPVPGYTGPYAPPQPARKTGSFVLLAVIGLGLVVMAAVGGLFIFNALGKESPTDVAAALTHTAPANAPEPTLTHAPEPSATSAEIALPVETATDTPLPSETPLPSPTATPAAPIIGGADKIAFLFGNDVWVANLDGSDLVQLTTDQESKFNLIWMPDGQHVAYISGDCINQVGLDHVVDRVACFEGALFLDGFDISPDASQIAISLNRELFIVTFDAAVLKEARSRNNLIALSTCEHFAPYDRGSNVSSKSVQFSEDGTRIALLRLSPGASGLQEDLIHVLDISACVEKPPSVDSFPATRFTIDNYDVTPLLKTWDWNGTELFLMTNIVRNEHFGSLYFYNMPLFHGEKLDPINGDCCYVAPRWSPDGRFIFFAFQDAGQGENSVTVFYFVSFSSIGSGSQLVPMNLPEILTSREYTEAAFRAAQNP